MAAAGLDLSMLCWPQQRISILELLLDMQQLLWCEAKSSFGLGLPLLFHPLGGIGWKTHTVFKVWHIRAASRLLILQP